MIQTGSSVGERSVPFAFLQGIRDSFNSTDKADDEEESCHAKSEPYQPKSDPENFYYLLTFQAAIAVKATTTMTRISDIPMFIFSSLLRAPEQ